MRKEPTDGEKIFAVHISDKRLVPRIHKELLQFNNKRINIPIKNE